MCETISVVIAQCAAEPNAFREKKRESPASEKSMKSILSAQRSCLEGQIRVRQKELLPIKDNMSQAERSLERAKRDHATMK